MLSKNVSQEGKIVANTTVKYCPRHSTTAISLVCTTCESLHCELCRPQHAGHSLQPIQNNGKLVHTVCRSQTQTCYNVLSVLEKEKDDRADLAAFYIEAKTKVRDQIKHLISKAMEIQSQLETKLDEAHSYAQQSETKVENDIRRVDDCISQLHGVRNVRDVDVLVPQAVDNAVMLAEFQHLKGKVDDTAHILPKIETIFPNLDKYDGAIKELTHVFHIVVQEEIDKFLPYDYSNIIAIDTISVPNATTSNYQMCDTDRNETNEIVLHGHEKNDIVRYDIKTNEFARIYSDFNIWSCVKLVRGSFVGKEYAMDNKLHLFGPDGSTRDTFVTKGGCDYALCFYRGNKLLKLNRKSEWSCRVVLSVINASSGRLTVENVIKITTMDEPDFMCKHLDKDLVSLVSDKSLYTVNLVTSAVDEDTIDNLIDLSTVCSFYVDSNDNKLVGVSGGKIHLFDSQMNHTVLTKVEGTPWGITVRGDKMFVAATGKIYIYGIPKK